MFDIGFLEIMFVALIALLVMGPERMPEAIRTATLWIARIKRSFQQMKNDIETEIGADEIKNQLHNEAILKSIEDAKSNIQSISDGLNQDKANLEYDIRDIVNDVKEPEPENNKDDKNND
jgi:sec-independent protein translocase protein TatB